MKTQLSENTTEHNGGPIARLSGTQRVWILNGAIATCGLILHLAGVRHLSPVNAGFRLPMLVLAAAFALTEIFVVHLEFRRNAHSVSLSELPLVVGLFFATPTDLVVAQVVGAAIALGLYRRQSPLKLVFNTSHLFLETALTVLIFHQFSRFGELLGPAGWIGGVVAAVAASLVGLTMIVMAISLSEGKAQFEIVPKMTVSGVIVSVTNASFGLVAAVLMSNNSAAAWGLIIPSATLILAYRGYTSIRERHESLEFLYESIRALHGSPNVDSAVQTLLSQARTTFQAEIAEIVLFSASADEPAVRTTLGSDDSIDIRAAVDPEVVTIFRNQFRETNDLVLVRTDDESVPLQGYLVERGMRDAMIAPLQAESRVTGVVLVANRLGDVSTFDAEDLKLFERFATHGSVMLQIGRLEKSLDEVTALKEELRLQAAALRESEARFKGAFQYAVTGLTVIGTDGRLIEVNDALSRMLGYSKEELLASSVSAITHPEDVSDNKNRFAALIGDDAPFAHFSTRYVHREGQIVWAEVSVSLVRGGGGRPLYFVAQVQDITETKAAEEERSRLIGILEATSDFVGMSDADGRRLYMNKAGRHMLGIGDTEDITATSIASNHADWAKEILLNDAIPTAIREGVWSGELAFLTSAGQEVPVSQVLIAHKAADGTVDFLSTIARDVSEHHRLEEQLRQSQKMDAVGRLAGGVAHDFNNLLAVILNYASFLAEDLEDGDQRRQDVDEIRRAGERAATLTRQLLTFSRREVVHLKILNLNEVVADMQKLLRRIVSENIEFRTDLSDALLPTKIDPGQLEQVLMNLVINARDAMLGGGTLLISTSNAEIDEEFGEHSTLEPGRYVCLTVSDTGRGMTREVMDHIFEPFFTTKPRGEGTGLGLATVYGIIQQAEGAISVYSEPDLGTTFKVYLPASGDAPADASELDAAMLQRGRGETILVAEDEDAVRNLVRRILVRNGYSVLTAGSPSEALEIFGEVEGAVDLLLTDVIMPEMTGKDLSQRLCDRQPRIKTVYMSGYTDQIIAHHDVLGDEHSFVQKPFTAEQLLRAVREAIDHHGAPLPDVIGNSQEVNPTSDLPITS